MERTPRLTIYTRKACCLCDDAKQVVAAARQRARFDVEEVDIDTNPALHDLYDHEVPVIAIDGSKAFKYRVTVEELLKKLAARL